jgi:hypothetical protein
MIESKNYNNLQNLNEKLLKFFNNKYFLFFSDLLRLLLFLCIVIIIFILLKEIEAIKLLNYDPCLLCANKTGTYCMVPFEKTYGGGY